VHLCCGTACTGTSHTAFYRFVFLLFRLLPLEMGAGQVFAARGRFSTQLMPISSSLYSKKKSFNIVYIGTTQFGSILLLTITNVPWTKCKMISALLDIFWIPIGGFLSFLIFISAINKSIGVRKAYVNLLLRIFEVNIVFGLVCE